MDMDTEGEALLQSILNQADPTAGLLEFLEKQGTPAGQPAVHTTLDPGGEALLQQLLSTLQPSNTLWARMKIYTRSNPTHQRGRPRDLHAWPGQCEVRSGDPGRTQMTGRSWTQYMSRVRPAL